MNVKYENVHELFKSDPVAKYYFDGLPDYVQATILERADRVNSFDSLQDYAQNLTRGDQ